MVFDVIHTNCHQGRNGVVWVFKRISSCQGVKGEESCGVKLGSVRHDPKFCMGLEKKVASTKNLVYKCFTIASWILPTIICSRLCRILCQLATKCTNYFGCGCRAYYFTCAEGSHRTQTMNKPFNLHSMFSLCFHTWDCDDNVYICIASRGRNWLPYSLQGALVFDVHGVSWFQHCFGW